MENVEKKQFKKICKHLSTSMDDIGEALKLIEQLEPRPGRNFLPMGTTLESQYITPDVYVYKVGGKFVIDCNDDGLPKLKISPFYLKQIKEALRGDPSKAYIRDKLNLRNGSYGRSPKTEDHLPGRRKYLGQTI